MLTSSVPLASGTDYAVDTRPLDSPPHSYSTTSEMTSDPVSKQGTMMISYNFDYIASSDVLLLLHCLLNKVNVDVWPNFVEIFEEAEFVERIINSRFSNFNLVVG